MNVKEKKTDNKLVKKFYRPWQIQDDGETCFLEQGVICMGPATRSGCGVRCIEGNSPCRGCYGPSPEVTDAGAKMLSAIATMIDSKDRTKSKKLLLTLMTLPEYSTGSVFPNSILRRKL